MIKAIIFDCFGVIITDALSVIVSELSVTNPQGAQKVRDLVRASNRGVLDPQDSNQQIADILGLSFAEYQQQVRDGELKDPRVMNLIKELRRTYKTAMLSNISGEGMLKRFSEAERAEYFDVMVASADIGFAKPETEAYEITADRLGVRLEECVFLDDKQDFCDAARSVGMQAITFETFDQAHEDLNTILAK
ncbi:HAD-IA family hydrolase [Aeromicrobium sp.]|nr:HAD-IA family hydrolase [Candidatus Saccharibacteria bacterium]